MNFISHNHKQQVLWSLYHCNNCHYISCICNSIFSYFHETEMTSKCILILFILFTPLFNKAYAQTVPVFTWKNFDSSSHRWIPSLKTQDEVIFQQQITDLTDNFSSRTIVLIVDSYRPEYFKIKLGGKQCYENVASFQNKYYAPSVINPIRSLRHLNQTSLDVNWLPDNQFSASFRDEKIVFVNIPKQENDGSRADYDCRINQITFALNEQFKNERVVFILTARKSDEKIISRNRRAPSYLNNQRLPRNFTHPRLLTSVICLTKKLRNAVEEIEIEVDSVTVSKFTSNSSLVATIRGEDITIGLQIHLKIFTGYWYVNKTTLNGKLSLSSYEIYALSKNGSFRCSRIKFFNNENNDFEFITIKELQIQPNFNESEPIVRFGPAYDCIGCSTAPIWMGLIVMFFTLIFLTFGITCIIDIQMYKRLENPKEKTITIYTEDSNSGNTRNAK